MHWIKHFSTESHKGFLAAPDDSMATKASDQSAQCVSEEPAGNLVRPG
jgi:hypothetical protein